MFDKALFANLDCSEAAGGLKMGWGFAGGLRAAGFWGIKIAAKNGAVDILE